MTKAEYVKQWRASIPGGYSLWQKRYRLKNRERIREWERANHEKNKERDNARQRERRTLAKTVKYLYGMSQEQYDGILRKQDNRCAICREEFTQTFKPFVDHSHDSLQVRGLLCNFCNLALGKFKESVANLTRAVAYLQQPETGIKVNERVHNWRKNWKEYRRRAP